MNKMVMVAILFFVVLVGCVGCHNQQKHVSIEETALNHSKSIIAYIEQNDAKSLENMFSNYIKETHVLSLEIEEFLNFIDGTIVSYGDVTGNPGEKETTPEDGTVRELLTGSISNIITDKGKEYSVFFNYCYINKRNEDYIGLIYITIVDESTYNSKNGYPFYGRATIGEI